MEEERRNEMKNRHLAQRHLASGMGKLAGANAELEISAYYLAVSSDKQTLRIVKSTMDKIREATDELNKYLSE